jgi:hypothetical protein
LLAGGGVQSTTLRNADFSPAEDFDAEGMLHDLKKYFVVFSTIFS